MVFIPYGDSGSLHVLHDSTDDSTGQILLSFENNVVRHGTDDSLSTTSILDLQTLYSSTNYFLQDSDLTDIASQSTAAVRSSAFPEVSEDTTPTQVWIG